MSSRLAALGILVFATVLAPSTGLAAVTPKVDPESIRVELAGPGQEAVVRLSVWPFSRGEQAVLECGLLDPSGQVLLAGPKAVGAGGGDEVRFGIRFRPRMRMEAKTTPSRIYDYYNPQAAISLAPTDFSVR